MQFSSGNNGIAILQKKKIRTIKINSQALHSSLKRIPIQFLLFPSVIIFTYG